MPNINHAFTLIVMLVLSAFVSSAQSEPRMKCDSIFTVTEAQFDSIVDNSLTLLKTKKLAEISDEQHRNMIRAFNKIWISRIETPKYAKGKYAELDKILSQQSYIDNMLKIYPDWAPNTGMGMYFFKLNVEYGGTPCYWSIFKVIKQDH